MISHEPADEAFIARVAKARAELQGKLTYEERQSVLAEVAEHASQTTNLGKETT